MDPALPTSLAGLLTVGDHLIRPPGRRNHNPYNTIVKMRSILEAGNVPRTFQIEHWLVSLSCSCQC